jgi:predicted metal-dependent hydrolase
LGTILVSGRKVSYTVRRGDGRKSAELRFRGDQELEVVLPQITDLKAEDVLRKKRPWIERAHSELVQRKHVFDGHRLLYKGEYYRIEFAKSNDTKTVRLLDNKILVSAQDGNSAMESLREWMKRETLVFLRNRIWRYARRLGVEVRSYEVADIRSWGRCTNDGQMTLNSHLVALPRELAEYVALHEILHTVEFNHSRSFRRRLVEQCPDYLDRERALRTYTTLNSHTTLRS